jgi:hypothetical protein
VSMSFDDKAKEIVLWHIQHQHLKTTDPWHQYANSEGVIIYQWGIITDVDEFDPSHLLIIFETSDKEGFDRNHELADQFIRENGGRQ